MEAGQLWREEVQALKDKEYKNLTIKTGEIFSEIEPIIKPSMLIGSILNAKITVIR